MFERGLNKNTVKRELDYETGRCFKLCTQSDTIGGISHLYCQRCGFGIGYRFDYSHRIPDFDRCIFSVSASCEQSIELDFYLYHQSGNCFVDLSHSMLCGQFYFAESHKNFGFVQQIQSCGSGGKCSGHVALVPCSGK